MMDYLVLTSESITDYIPLGYKKEEPEKYYNLVEDHIHWMEKCRTIVITNINLHDHFIKEQNHNGATLASVLEAIKEIDNINYIRSKKQLHVLVLVQHQGQTIKRITEALTSAQFGFKPQIAKKFNPTGSLGSSKTGTSKYSAVLAKHHKDKSPNTSVASSIGGVSRLTGVTGRSWTTNRKIPKEIDFSDTTEFPPINPTQETHHGTSIQSSNLQQPNSSITDTMQIIQQAIDTALKKAYKDHWREITAIQDKYQRQIEALQQRTDSTTLENKFDKKFDKLMEMMTAMTGNVIRESPLRKKGKPSSEDNMTPPRYQQDISNDDSHSVDTNMSTDNQVTEPATDPLNTALPTSPNRDQNFEFEDTKMSLVSRFNEDQYEADNDQWINPHAAKERKHQQKSEKKSADHKNLYQQTIIKTIKHNNNSGSPARLPRKSPDRPGRGSPIKANRYTAPRPLQAEKHDGTKVILSSLSSTRRDHMDSRGRES
jgi:hypothetical protein